MTPSPDLIAWTLRLARTFAREHPRCPVLALALIEPGDLAGAALLGLCEAARAFDAGKGVPFRIFARRRVLGAMWDAVRAAMPLGFREKRWRDARAVRTGDPGTARVPVVHAASRWQSRRWDAGRRAWVQADPEAFLAVIPAKELPIGWELESEDAVERMARQLPAKHGRAVILRFLDAGCPDFAAIGRALGVGEAQVWRVMGEARREIRRLAS